MKMKSKSEPSRTPRVRFKLRTLVLMVLVACALFSLIGVKMRQDVRRWWALSELQDMGFNWTLYSEDGHSTIDLRCEKPFVSDDFDTALKYMENLTHS